MKRTVQVASRPIADLTVEALLAQRNQKPEFRKQQRDAAIKAAKEAVRVKKDESKKKMKMVSQYQFNLNLGHWITTARTSPRECLSRVGPMQKKFE